MQTSECASECYFLLRIRQSHIRIRQSTQSVLKFIPDQTSLRQVKSVCGFSQESEMDTPVFLKESPECSSGKKFQWSQSRSHEVTEATVLFKAVHSTFTFKDSL